MGNPVSHSKSPKVHTLFASQFGIELEYRAIHVDIGGFEQAVSGFQAGGGAGINVTVPFKINARKLSDQLSARAKLANAVNTLVLDKRIYGDNTDGAGLVTDITKNLNVDCSGASILIIGAGGAVQGIVGPLLETKPDAVVIANRTIDKAINLAAGFSSLGPVNGCGLDQLESGRFDIVINATSTSLSNRLPDVPPSIFANAELAYDLAYGDHPTSFQVFAKQSGARRSVDGLGMLIEQAAESFFL